MSVLATARGRFEGKHELVRARQHKLVEGLHYRRVLKEARATMNQGQTAEPLVLSQPAVAKALTTA